MLRPRLTINLKCTKLTWLFPALTSEVKYIFFSLNCLKIWIGYIYQQEKKKTGESVLLFVICRKTEAASLRACVYILTLKVDNTCMCVLRCWCYKKDFQWWLKIMLIWLMTNKSKPRVLDCYRHFWELKHLMKWKLSLAPVTPRDSFIICAACTFFKG